MSDQTPYPHPPSGQTPKRLTRSSDDRWIAGVCGGLARYFGVDPNLVRLVVAITTILGFCTPVLIYIVAWILIPQDS